MDFKFSDHSLTTTALSDQSKNNNNVDMILTRGHNDHNGHSSSSSSSSNEDSVSEPTLTDLDSPTIIANIVYNNNNNGNGNCKNVHEISYQELMIQLRRSRQQKRNLRSVLRTFEIDFYKKTGHPVEKEDRCHMSSVYNSYKVNQIIIIIMVGQI